MSQYEEKAFLDLARSLEKGKEVSVRGIGQRVLAKAAYATEDKPQEIYYKVFLDSCEVLVISPGDALIYFGRDVGHLGDGLMEQGSFNHEGQAFQKIGAGRQKLLRVESGDSMDVEGEVRFVDFTSEDETKIISLGVIEQTGCSADIVADVVSLDDIVVKP